MKEVTVDATKTHRLDAALHRLKAVIDGVSSVGPLTLADAREHLDALRVVLPLDLFPSTAVQWKVQYEPPSAVHVIGSYLLRTTARPTLNVDVAVVVPAVCRWLAGRGAPTRRRGPWRDIPPRRFPCPGHRPRHRVGPLPSERPLELSLPPQARVLPGGSGGRAQG